MDRPPPGLEWATFGPMHDLTTGSLTRHLLKTTSFMLVAMVFQTLYYLVDLYWVGRLGKEAVAGVGVAGNLMFIVLSVTQMLAVGTTTLISHAAGRKERRSQTGERPTISGASISRASSSSAMAATAIP